MQRQARRCADQKARRPCQYHMSRVSCHARCRQCANDHIRHIEVLQRVQDIQEESEIWRTLIPHIRSPQGLSG